MQFADHFSTNFYKMDGANRGGAANSSQGPGASFGPIAERSREPVEGE
jgi:hypothetical protein